jgi:hypothetical protein
MEIGVVERLSKQLAIWITLHPKTVLDTSFELTVVHLYSFPIVKHSLPIRLVILPATIVHPPVLEHRLAHPVSFTVNDFTIVVAIVKLSLGLMA